MMKDENASSAFRIRRAGREDMDYIISQAKNEGWNPGLHDGDAFFAADNDGFYIGALAGRPIGCISAVRYEDFGFMGFYVVEEQYRGQGYGMKLWHQAMDALAGCNIGLDGVTAQQENYRQSGFRLANRNLRFEGNSVGFPAALEESEIVEAGRVPLVSLLAYDRLHFPASRRAFLEHWMAMLQARTLVSLREGRVAGMGTIRQCYHGYKIGPLFAEDFSVAENLFLALSAYAQGETVYLDISEENPPANALVAKYNMKFVFETARMYTGPKPKARWEEVYGLTSFELG